MKQKIFLFGYYGYGNLGDELLADYYRTLFAELFPDRERLLLVGPLFHRRLLPGERLCSRWSLPQLAAATKRGDLWVAGGGGLLQNVTSRRTLHYYLSLIKIAQIRGARVTMLGQGFGPLRGRLEYALTRRIISNIDLVETRDEGAWRGFQNMGLDPSRLIRGIDPIWNVKLPPVFSAGNSLLILPRASELPVLESVLRPALTGGLPVKIMSLNPADDRRLRQTYSQQYSGNIGNLAEFSTALEDVGAVVSSRLHGLILAAKAGLPVVGFGNQPKLRECCRALGQAWYAAEHKDLSVLFLRILRASGGEKLQQRVVDLVKTAEAAKRKLAVALAQMV